MDYAKTLCELMERNGVSSYKLAKDIGVHVSTISNWRHGKSPKVEHLKLVANYFGITVDTLLCNNGQYVSQKGGSYDTERTSHH